jgi:hypothetical protein
MRQGTVPSDCVVNGETVPTFAVLGGMLQAADAFPVVLIVSLMRNSLSQHALQLNPAPFPDSESTYRLLQGGDML